MQLGSLAEEFINTSIYNSLTAHRIRSLVRVFCERADVDEIELINLSAISRYKEISLKKIKPITFNGNIKYLRVLFNYAVQAGYLTENIFSKIKLAPIGKPRKKHYSLDEVEHIVQSTKRLSTNALFWTTLVEMLSEVV